MARAAISPARTTTLKSAGAKHKSVCHAATTGAVFDFHRKHKHLAGWAAKEGLPADEEVLVGGARDAETDTA